MNFSFELNNRTRYSYEAYRLKIDDLLGADKTTGENHSEAMLGYTNMNVTRMNRLDKRAKLGESLQQILTDAPVQKWLVLTEAWCGDAAQNLPWIVKMAEKNENISLELILRDENLDIMDAYLTKGGRSIPKLIAIGENNEVLFDWGPRSEAVQSLYTDLKAAGKEYGEISKELHTWYAKDKGKAIQEEFSSLLSA